MRIDPKVEKPARDMLEHAIRGELDELATLIQAVGNETYLGAIGLCLTTAGYIAIDVGGTRWPSDTVLRKIAHNAAGAETRLNLSEPDIYDYLSRAALGLSALTRRSGLSRPLLLSPS
jgi:hypothetical protein